MSLRDEMAQELCLHYYRVRWDATNEHGKETCYRIADALMPLVERAVDLAVSEGWHCGRGSDPDKGEISQHEAAAIVARVLK